MGRFKKVGMVIEYHILAQKNSFHKQNIVDFFFHLKATCFVGVPMEYTYIAKTYDTLVLIGCILAKIL